MFADDVDGRFRREENLVFQEGEELIGVVVERGVFCGCGGSVGGDD